MSSKRSGLPSMACRGRENSFWPSRSSSACLFPPVLGEAELGFLRTYTGATVDFGTISAVCKQGNTTCWCLFAAAGAGAASPRRFSKTTNTNSHFLDPCVLFFASSIWAKFISKQNKTKKTFIESFHGSKLCFVCF